jgi:magnesium transporter
VHRLALEDVLTPTTRPKVEDFETHYLVIMKMLSFDEETESIIAEQVSLIVGERYLFTFQERVGDVFEPVRERLRQSKGRIRSRGTDYLAYALIDAIVDSYYRILETVGDRIEEIEEAALGEPTMEVMRRIHNLKREMLILRRAIWPLREATGQLYRGEVPLVTPETQLFLRDVHDHCVQVIDTVETLREVLSGAMDLYMSGVSNRMNEVMKVLTIIATIFIPLSFFAGLYGMNFDYMPELHVRWAYPVLLGGMATVAGGMLWYFHKKGWL